MGLQTRSYMPSLVLRSDSLSEYEEDQDSITKELFATVEVNHMDDATPSAQKNETYSTISVHFSTTFVNRKHQEPRPATTPIELVKSFMLGGTNSLTYSSDPLPQSKPAGGPIARAALFDRPPPPDPTSIFSFPPGIASPAPDLPKHRRQLRRSWTLLDVIKDDPFQGVNEVSKEPLSGELMY